MNSDYLDLDINEQMIKLGLKVLYYRKLRNLTQDELSEKSGISTVVISRIENTTTNMEVMTILKIAKALKVNPHKLFDFREMD